MPFVTLLLWNDLVGYPEARTNDLQGASKAFNSGAKRLQRRALRVRGTIFWEQVEWFLLISTAV